MESLTFANLTIRPDMGEKLLDVLDGLGDEDILLESVVVRSCRVYDDLLEVPLGDRVELTWEDVTEICSDDSDDEGEESDGCPGCPDCEWRPQRGRFGYYLFD